MRFMLNGDDKIVNQEMSDSLYNIFGKHIEIRSFHNYINSNVRTLDIIVDTSISEFYYKFILWCQSRGYSVIELLKCFSSAINHRNPPFKPFNLTDKIQMGFPKEKRETVWIDLSVTIHDGENKYRRNVLYQSVGILSNDESKVTISGYSNHLTYQTEGFFNRGKLFEAITSFSENSMIISDEDIEEFCKDALLWIDNVFTGKGMDGKYYFTKCITLKSKDTYITFNAKVDPESYENS